MKNILTLITLYFTEDYMKTYMKTNELVKILINTIRFVIMVLLDSEKFQRVLFCRKFRRGLVLNRL